MKYRPDKNGTMISQLGYGCMRFTKKGPNIDFAKAERHLRPLPFKAAIGVVRAIKKRM